MKGNNYLVTIDDVQLHGLHQSASKATSGPAFHSEIRETSEKGEADTILNLQVTTTAEAESVLIFTC
jgi:hypothetical protein